MAEFDFPGLGLLIDQLKRPDGISWFFERGRPDANGTENDLSPANSSKNG